jgi:DNA polymerase-3 subunit beta
MPGFILHRDSVYEVHAALENMSGDLSIDVGKDEIRFRTNVRAYQCKPIDGTYPDYKQVFPSGRGTIARIPRKEFIDALEAIFLSAHEPSEAFRIALSPTSFQIRPARSSNEFDAKSIEISLLSGAADMTLGMNGRYLHDILRRLDEDFIDLKLDGPTDPVSFHEIQSGVCSYVLMPMRI